MKIETEFNIGDEVWAIYMLDADEKYGVIGPKRIVYIEIHVWNGRAYQHYEFSGVCGLFSPDKIFKTREAAEITAEALNK